MNEQDYSELVDYLLHPEKRQVAEMQRAFEGGKRYERKRIRERAKDAMVMEEIAYAMFSVPEKDDNDTDPCGDYFRRLADKAVEVFLNPIIYQLTTGGDAIGIGEEDV